MDDNSVSNSENENLGQNEEDTEDNNSLEDAGISMFDSSLQASFDRTEDDEGEESGENVDDLQSDGSYYEVDDLQGNHEVPLKVEISDEPSSPKRSLSAKAKMEIVQQIESGVKKTDICNERNISEETLKRIWKNRHLMPNYSPNSNSSPARTAHIHSSKILDAALLEWLQGQLSRKEPHFKVNGAILRRKAMEIAQQLNIPTFNATEKWLARWKKRRGVLLRGTSGTVEIISQPPSVAAADPTSSTDDEALGFAPNQFLVVESPSPKKSHTKKSSKSKKLEPQVQWLYPTFYECDGSNNLHQFTGVHHVSLLKLSTADLNWATLFTPDNLVQFHSVTHLQLPKNMDYNWKLYRIGRLFPYVKNLICVDIGNYGLLSTFGEVWPALENLEVTFHATSPKLDSVITGFPHDKCQQLLTAGLNPKNLFQATPPDGPSIRGLTELKHLRIYNRIVKTHKPYKPGDNLSGITDVSGYYGISYLRSLRSLELVPNDLTKLCQRAIIATLNLKSVNFGSQKMNDISSTYSSD